ncbi:hypothetical protein RI367_005326 [Sorochytrium milnesiophthora]
MQSAGTASDELWRGMLWLCTAYYAAIVTALGVILTLRSLSPLLFHGKQLQHQQHQQQQKEHPQQQRHGFQWRFQQMLVSKQWFWHFYALAVACCIGNMRTMTGSLPFLCFFVHVARRLYEQLAVFPRSHSLMHVGHYLLGMSYYAFTSLSFIASANLHRHSTSTPRDSASRVLSAVGLALYGTASYIQHAHHRLLAAQPKPFATTRAHGSHLSKPHYTLPKGGLFAHVVAPHYFAECLLYVSFAVLQLSAYSSSSSSSNIMPIMAASLACLLWVVLTMMINAHQTWKYYHNVPPSSRGQLPARRLIPFVW